MSRDDPNQRAAGHARLEPAGTRTDPRIDGASMSKLVGKGFAFRSHELGESWAVHSSAPVATSHDPHREPHSTCESRMCVAAEVPGQRDPMPGFGTDAPPARARQVLEKPSSSAEVADLGRFVYPGKHADESERVPDIRGPIAAVSQTEVAAGGAARLAAPHRGASGGRTVAAREDRRDA